MAARWWVVALACAGCREVDDDPEIALPAGLARALAEGRAARLVVDFQPLDDADEQLRQTEDFVAALPVDAWVTRTYQNFPRVVVEVADLVAAEAIRSDPAVWVAYDEVEYRPSLARSLALVGQPVVASAGSLGTGTAVAVLDSGADWTVADLGGCAAAGPGCRVAYAADFAPDDGLRDDAGHGTNLASIVAAVAPGTQILALDVFDGPVAYTGDVAAAIDWVITNKALYNVAAIDLSLEEGLYGGGCADGLGLPIAAAHDAGISVVTSTGNGGSLDQLSAPACNYQSLAVGAVYDEDLGPMVWPACADATTTADQIACFTNRGDGIDLLAPGAMITAGGYTMGGTSQAAAHVAGALAVLRGLDARPPAGDLEEQLQSHGPILQDPLGYPLPRLDLAAALATCVWKVQPHYTSLPLSSAAQTYAVDVFAYEGCVWETRSEVDWVTYDRAGGVGDGTVWVTVAENPGPLRLARNQLLALDDEIDQYGKPPPPDGIVIDAGAAGTMDTAVDLTLTGANAATMCVSNTGACGAWQPYAAQLPWTLTAGAGTKTVYAWFKDAAGTISGRYSDTIVLDATKPTNGTVSASPADQQAVLSWTGFTDAGAGLDHYLVMQASGAVAPTNCVGTPVWSGSGAGVAIGGLVNGSAYAFRVCAVDGAGNVSTGAVASVTVKSEADPPVGSVVLNGGAAYAASSAVTATLAATDATGVTQACLSNTSTCATTAWFPMTSTKAWTLVTGAGTKTVYAWFKDPNGNVSTSTVDTIVVDTTKPADGTVAASGATGAMTLSWSGFTDANGVVGYTAVYGTTLPATCAAGTQAYSGSATTATVTGLADGATYAARVCAVDGAGNVSAGATVTYTVAPEHAAPTGTVTLAGGAGWTNVAKVDVALSAVDASGVAQMCLSSTSTCTAFTPYAAATTTTLTTTAGTKTLYATFSDPWGNVSAAVSDTIGYDAVAPTGGTLTATGGAGQVALVGAGFTDVTSGVASYKVVYAATTAPASCALGTVGYAGPSAAPTVTGLTDGTTYGLRMCAVDQAGNTSAGVTTTARPAPEYAPPTGTVVANGGAAWTKVRSLTLDLTASDPSGVARYCVATGTTCTAWKTWAATAALTPTAGDGQKTSYAWFEDAWGNQTTPPVSDAIGVDSTAPKNGTLTATAGVGSVGLTWTGFSDLTSGVTSYQVVYQTGTSPSSCATGTLGYSGSSSGATVSGLTSGTKYFFRACAVDLAGNSSTGALANAIAR